MVQEDGEEVSVSFIHAAVVLRQLGSSVGISCRVNLSASRHIPKDVICQDIWMTRGILMPLIATTSVPRVNLFVDTWAIFPAEADDIDGPSSNEGLGPQQRERIC